MRLPVGEKCICQADGEIDPRRKIMIIFRRANIGPRARNYCRGRGGWATKFESTFVTNAFRDVRLIVSLLARFRAVTRVSRAFKDRATRDELVLIVLTRESSATRPSAGWRRRASTDVKARATIHRAVRALFSRVRTGETRASRRAR